MKIGILLRFVSLLSFLPATFAADWIWVEGEQPASASVTRHPGWYDQVPKTAFSGGNFISHFHETDPGEIGYRFEARAGGDYEFWVRANPQSAQLSFQLNGAPWKEIPLTNSVQKFNLIGWDMRFLGWSAAGRVSLETGENKIRFRLTGQPKPHGMIDCFVFTPETFRPYGIEKPDAAALAWQHRESEATHWVDFAPPQDTFSDANPIDLRHLNEKHAGQNGRIIAQNGQFLHRTSKQPVRFWAVNGPPHDLTGTELKQCARLLAKRGVNLVRIHGAVFDGKTGALETNRLAHIVQVVEAMKAEGIYTHLSIYFPLWFKPAANLAWMPGYDGNKHPFAALMFNREFQARWTEWWRAVLLAKTSENKPLLAEPALLGVEVQNEDSFFFWTFSAANLPDPQLALLEAQFGAWLSKKYGTLESAFAKWGGSRLQRDQISEGRAAFRSLYDIVSRKSVRDQDTVAFLLETQLQFYRTAVQTLREIGFDGLITCSNWTTAHQELLGPLEKLSYTPGDFIDRHGYFGCRNSGLFSEWSIRDGHTYVDRSALRFDAEEPGHPRQFNHPVIDIEYDHKPSMISETTWTRPNRYRSEAPLYYAAYGALQDSDAIVHFALDGATWDVKPRFFMQAWTLLAPSQAAQFPAAALIYRGHLVKTGAVLARVSLNTNDLVQLKGTPLPQDAAFDELRLKDVPSGLEVQPGNRIDPLIHYAGRTQVDFGDGPARVELAPLQPFIDRTNQTVTSSTGELVLQYGQGLLLINAPSAQGASGNLRAGGAIQLRDLNITSSLDLGHIIAVSLDGLPLRESRRVLVQAMSEERASGFRTIAQGDIRLIESIGRNPWQIRKLEGRVQFRTPHASNLKVRALTANGDPQDLIGTADDFPLRPETVYYLIE